MDNAVALVPTEQPRENYALMRPVVSPAALVEVHKEITELITTALVEGTDYGVIPGTDSTKPTLLKPGAERLCTAFGVYPRYTIISTEIDHNREIVWKKRKKVWGKKRGEYWEEVSGTSLGLYRYVVRCELVKRGDKIVIADGIGSASTLEAKYIDRPRDCENTVLKMAEKRAFVAATLNGCGLSGRFTQDMEDLVEAAESPSTRNLDKPTAGQLASLKGYASNDRLPPDVRRYISESLERGLTAQQAIAIADRAAKKLTELDNAANAPPPWMESAGEPPRERVPGEEIE